MTEIPPWRCLLVRTWPENGEPAYHRDQFTVTVTLELVSLRFLDGPHGAGTRRHQRAAPPAAPPREISFTAGRAAITSARHGTATAGVPRPLISAACQAVTAGIGRRLTPGGPQPAPRPQDQSPPGVPEPAASTAYRTAPAVITICGAAA